MPPPPPPQRRSILHSPSSPASWATVGPRLLSRSGRLARRTSAGSSPPPLRAWGTTAGAGSRRLRETADSSSLAIRPSSSGSRRLRETAGSSAATRPSSAAGLRQTAAAPSGSGPPTGVPLPDLRTMVDELAKDLSRMRHDISVIEDKADRKLESVAALHEFWNTKKLAMEKKLDISNAKIAELEGVIKLMQAEDSSIQDRSKGKHVAKHTEHQMDLMAELNKILQTLEVMLSTLEHAWHCNMRPCAKQYCGDFKMMLVHVSNCLPQPKERDCNLCRSILPLLYMHSRGCTTKFCTLVCCKDKSLARNHLYEEGTFGPQNQ